MPVYTLILGLYYTGLYSYLGLYYAGLYSYLGLYYAGLYSYSGLYYIGLYSYLCLYYSGLNFYLILRNFPNLYKQRSTKRFNSAYHNVMKPSQINAPGIKNGAQVKKPKQFQ